MNNQKKGKVRQRFNPKGEPLFRCPFPNCGSIFAKEPGKPETCIKHRTLIADVVYIVDHLKTPEAEPEESGPKIFVPPPGMSDQAIQEAIKSSKGGKKQ